MSYMKGSYLENKTILINLLPYLHVRSLLRLGMVSSTLRAFVQTDKAWYVSRTRFEPYFPCFGSLRALFGQFSYFLTRHPMQWENSSNPQLIKHVLKALLLASTMECGPITRVEFTKAPNIFVINDGSGIAKFILDSPRFQLDINLFQGPFFTIDMASPIKNLRKKLKI